MKRFFACCLLLLLAFSFSACDQEPLPTAVSTEHWAQMSTALPEENWDLIGVWENDWSREPITLVFAPDGSAQILGEIDGYFSDESVEADFHYTVEDDMIYLTAEGESVPLGYYYMLGEILNIDFSGLGLGNVTFSRVE